MPEGEVNQPSHLTEELIAQPRAPLIVVQSGRGELGLRIGVNVEGRTP